MSYKSLLVHVGLAGEADEALLAAVKIAQAYEATVIGLGAEALELPPGSEYACDGMLIQELRNQVEQELTAAETQFLRATAAAPCEALWLSSCADPTRAMRQHARGADLIVAARPSPHLSRGQVPDLVELLMDASAPVFLVPASGQAFEGRRVVVAWKDTLETCRAITAALPMLVRAEEVVVAAVSKAGRDDDPSARAEVVDRLKRHGVAASGRIIARGSGAVAEDLENAADLVGADLLVLGAFGHSRLQEWALGGVTRDLVTASSKYILFGR